MAKAPTFFPLFKFLEFVRESFDNDELEVNYDDFITWCHCEDDMAVLKTMRMLSGMLSKLAYLVDDCLEFARDELLPDIRRRGMYSLPFEVTAQIFEILHEDKESSALLMANRYFRGVGLRVPKLWTRLDSKRDPFFSLERSRSLDIEIGIANISRNYVNINRFLNLIQPHRERWKSLHIVDGGEEIDSPHSQSHLCLRRLRDEFDGQSFPALETLEIEYGMNLPWDAEGRVIDIVNDDHENMSIRSFFASWNMPSLRCVDVNGFLPILPLTCQRNLTRFRFTISPRRWHNAVYINDLHAILNFLRSLPALEELMLDIQALHFIHEEGESVELPHVRSLEFRTGRSLDIAYSLLERILMPNLKELTLILETITQDEGQGFMEVIFLGSSCRWPYLEAMSCYIDVETYDNDVELNEPLNSLCINLPPVQHLTIESPTLFDPTNRLTVSCETSIWHGQQPPLRTLRLVKCDKFQTSFIFNLEDIIKAPEFELLEIVDCPNIKSEIVRQLIPAGKKFKCKEHDWDGLIRKFK